MAAASNVLEVDGLGVEIDTEGAKLWILRDLSFAIPAGGSLALVGESGSGKTTTALAILGLLPRGARREKGVIRFGGKEVAADGPLSHDSLRGRHIAMIFQDPASALNPVFRVGTQVKDVIRTHFQTSGKEARRRVLALFDRVGLSDPEGVYRAYPHQLSGGMAQRVMIAMALSCRPQLLIADEPTTALDVVTSGQIVSLLSELRQEGDFALLLISHDMKIVSELVEEVVVIRKGRLVEKGDTDTILKRPHHPYTRLLVESGLGRSLMEGPGVVRRVQQAPHVEASTL